jgi:phytoene synthase
MTTTMDGQTEGMVGVEPETLERSRAFCREITRKQAKNFYYGLKLLPEPKRTAMYALYAYMRLVDDIADDESNGRTVEQRKKDLDQWEALTVQAIDAGKGGGAAAMPRGHILWPAFGEMAARYRVPVKVFGEMITGQRQDLAPAPVPNFAALREYCYRVASVVGVASLYVWGFDGGEETLKLGAEKGIAFQLTNILRDLCEDAARGRCYLPVDELERFGVTIEHIASGKASREFMDLMTFQINRADGFYARSAALKEKVMMDSRPTLVAMTGIYHGLLEKIKARPERVLKRRVKLSTLTKVMIGWRAMRGK